MLSAATSQGRPDNPIARLAEALDLCQPLLRSSQETLRIFPVVQEAESAFFDAAAMTRCNAILSAIGSRYGFAIPHFVWPAPQQPSSLEMALSNFCGLGLEGWRTIATGATTLSVELAVSGFDKAASPTPRNVLAMSLPPFATFSRGVPKQEAIIIVPPCGVPARLFQPWLESLANRHFVITFENPYLFTDWRSRPEPSGEIATEAAYIGAVLQEYRLARAHLVGICGGAPVAVLAAAEYGQKIVSLVVCHGDLNFGPGTPRTSFQMQFQGLLSEAATSLERARQVYSMFLDPAILFGVPPQLAPFILYPYTDVAIFRRYARINSGLMAYDASSAARKLTQPVLIVTNPNDRMTHPGASRLLHQIVSRSRLWVRNATSHHDVLLANQELFASIQDFVC